MGKHREKQHDSSYDENVESLHGEIDYELDDIEFEQQFRPQKNRYKANRARDARRRIEEFREDRELAKRLGEFYDDWND